jgi:TonB family protein
MRLDWKNWAIAAALLASFAVCGLAEDRMRVATDDAMHAATTKVAPTYSPVARQLKLEGDVKVDVSIGEDGGVQEVSSVAGNPVLFQCVKDAVKRWKFSPFKSDGKPAKAIATLSFAFHL